MIISGIYIIENIISNKIYIGSSVDLEKRKIDHFSKLSRGKHKNPHIQLSYNKHGKEAFVFRVLVKCDKKDLLFMEQHFMDKFNPDYNMLKIAGNRYGHYPSKETRLKMSLAQMGRESAMKGRKHTKEAIEKIRITSTGRAHSDSVRKRLSEFHKGKKLSESTKQKLREINTGKKQSKETIRKRTAKISGRLNYLAKPISQYDFDGNLINEFDTITDAAKHIKGNVSVISRAVNGYTSHAYNFKWVKA